jgi:multidrug efflux pump
MAVFLVMVAVMLVLFLNRPTSFLPQEDQGTLYVQATAPVGATQERTMNVVRQIEDYFFEHETEAVDSMFGVQGFSFGGTGQNIAFAFVKLKHWDERDSEDLSVSAVAARASGALSAIRDAMVFAFVPPPIRELGRSAGFNLYLMDYGGQGHEELMSTLDELLQQASGNPLLRNVRLNGQKDAPQFRLDIDLEKASALGVPLADINTTLQAAWGGQYIDDFIDRGRVKRVYLQADAPYRMVPEDFRLWSVRNKEGEMVPLSSFVSSHWEFGPPDLARFNGTPAVEVLGQPAPGVSSGDAMAEMEAIIAGLPDGFGLAWTGVSYQEQQAGTQTPLLYTLSIIFVFLCLAALYESWSIPTAVLMAAPIGVLGIAAAATLRGLDRDIFFQVAMLATIGLSSKNAILIIAFAKQNVDAGMDLIEATLGAVRDRLRPIIMTSLAFGMGVLPLALASGAGSSAQRAIGTGVIGGMLAGAFLGMFFVPLFFVLVQRLFGHRDSQAGT